MSLLASLNVASNAMCQAMLPWVKVGVLLLLLGLELLEDLALLLLCQFFAIDTSILG